MIVPMSLLFYLIAAGGAVAIYLLLPRPGGRITLVGLGTLLGATSLGGLVLWMAKLHEFRVFGPIAQSDIDMYFYMFAAVALITAVRSMTHPHPVYCVLYFVLTVLAVGAALLLVWAEFLAVALILVYVGAILVLYVFVIMLAQHARGDGSLAEHDVRTRSPIAAVVLAFLLVCGLGGVIGNQANWPGPVMELALKQDWPLPKGTAAALGVELFNRQLLALELAGVLLVVAVVAAVALVRRRLAPGTDAEALRH